MREALLTTLLVLAIDESLCREEDARRDHVSLTVTSPRARVTDIRQLPPPPPLNAALSTSHHTSVSSTTRV